MIVIDNENIVSNWLTALDIDDVGFAKIDIVTFELAQGFETELVLIQDTVYHQLSKILQDKMNQVAGILVFNSTGSPLQYYLEKVVGVIDQNTPVALVRNQILFLEDHFKSNTVLKSQLMTLNGELMETIGGVETQLLRVKKVYEQTAPKRLENFKGFTVYSKYAAGEDMGGEFFDLFAKEGKIFLLMSATSSFLASSSILQFFAELKGETEINQAMEKNFISTIKGELEKINMNKKKPVETQLLTCIIDMNTLKVEGHVFGSFQVVSSNEDHHVDANTHLDGEFENAYFELQLERGERILFNSPGFSNNWDPSKSDHSVSELVNNTEIKALDVLDEIYFQLKKESKNGFLSHDASSIIMEVQQNVMVQV